MSIPKILIIVVSISLVIVLALLAIKTFAPSFIAKSIKSVSNETVLLPVDLENPSVITAALGYTFEGNILELTKLRNGITLKTDINTKGVPVFIVRPGTQIFFLDQENQLRPAQLADLKINQRVRVIALYGLKIKRWTVSRVNILVSSLPSDSSPSASLK